MSCGTALEARRNSDERWTFTPSSRNYTFSGMAPLFTVRRGETVLLQIDQTQTVNGSLFSVVGDSVVLQLKKGDAALLDGPTPDTDAEALFYDVTLTDQTGFENWIVGGPFTLLGLNDVSCGGCNEKVEVTIGGQCIQINIEGGNLGIGASVNLAALNQAVHDAETAAGEAEQSAADAAAAGANAGAASGATAGAAAGSASGASSGEAAANAVVANKANIDASNIDTSEYRDALFVSNDAVFDVAVYIHEEDPLSLEAIENNDINGQNPDLVLAAIRRAGDDAMAFMRARSASSVKLLLPAGTIGFKDEMFSDDFQAKFWDQSGLLKTKMLIVEGAGANLTTLQIRSDYVSSVRNTLNGNQRTYGPWAGQPSPSILISGMASNARGAPSGLTLRGICIRGTGQEGVDPVAVMVSNELNARHSDLYIHLVANSADWIMGSYNSIRSAIHVESCGAQPIMGGALVSNPAGFPPPWVRFDMTTVAGASTLTAKASEARGGYAVGDPVPFFYVSQVGKPFAVQYAASHNGVRQVARGVISSVPSDGSSTATVSFPAGVSLFSSGNLVDVAGSFFPVQATTTSGSATVTLSDPIKIGRGQRDMLGQNVIIPKAGSMANTDLDCHVSRIVSVSGGNDSSGYTQITLSEPVRNSVTEDLVWSVAHTTAVDETIRKTLASPFELNDCNFIQCRWENSGGYGEDHTTSSYQWIVQGSYESSKYISCKIHGANPVKGQFASEGQCIIDHSVGLQLTDIDFTHFGLRDSGQLRIMGASAVIQMVPVSSGGWQLFSGFSAVFLDPPSGWDLESWSVQRIGGDVKNLSFPVYDQDIVKASPLVSKMNLVAILQDRKKRIFAGMLLTSSDNLDSFVFDTVARIGSDVPVNTPPFTNNCIFVSKRMDSSRTYQMVLSPITGAMWWRGRNGSTWSIWRRANVLRTATTADFDSATSSINTVGKTANELVRNTTTSALYLARGSNPTDAWSVFNQDSSVVPS